MIVKDGPDEPSHHAVAMKASGRLKSGASVTPRPPPRRSPTQAMVPSNGVPLSRSVHREDIDGAAGRYLRILAREGLVHPALHAGGIDAPARLHGNVLLAVHLKRHGNAVNPRDRGMLPQDLSRLRVDGAEHA